MKLKSTVIKNYRGIKEETLVSFQDFNCIVGKNDVGKSTLLKAIDAFLNENNPNIEDKNVYSDSNFIEINLIFDSASSPIILDDTIPVSLFDEELVDENGLISVKKVWDVSQKTIKPKIFLCRKIYDADDFVMLSEKELRTLCAKFHIETAKANGEEYNNKEKREKLRAYHHEAGTSFHFDFEEMPATGTTRPKKIIDALKGILPTFEYFRADRSLSDSDTSVQKYFKDQAYKLLKSEISTDEVEDSIRHHIEEALGKITQKINQVVPEDEQVEAQVEFDWSKLISTSFRCKKDEANIPLTSRGDGFRRITMMSYFEMLAEEKHSGRDMLFGFEEPETFLHPETQQQLYSKLIGMKDNGYQILVTTHSPNIVAESNIEDLIFIQRIDGKYTVRQLPRIDIYQIIEELGIKRNSALLNVFGDIKVLFLLEGIDDVGAFNTLAREYKKHGDIEKTFDELGVLLIPVGGCGAIKHWADLQIIRKMHKPYYILLDSDKLNNDMDSPNLLRLRELGYDETNSSVTQKREIECYIHPDYFKTLNPPIEIEYGDWDDVKTICKNHESCIQLGGSKVCAKHFQNLIYEDLRKTFCPDGEHDEFLDIYHKIYDMCEA